MQAVLIPLQQIGKILNELEIWQLQNPTKTKADAIAFVSLKNFVND